MNFPSIDIQGSILSADLLAKIRSEQATYQQGKDFNTDYNNTKLKDEISLAWQAKHVNEVHNDHANLDQFDETSKMLS